MLCCNLISARLLLDTCENLAVIIKKRPALSQKIKLQMAEYSLGCAFKEKTAKIMTCSKIWMSKDPKFWTSAAWWPRLQLLSDVDSAIIRVFLYPLYWYFPLLAVTVPWTPEPIPFPTAPSGRLFTSYSVVLLPFLFPVFSVSFKRLHNTSQSWKTAEEKDGWMQSFTVRFRHLFYQVRDPP